MKILAFAFFYFNFLASLSWAAPVCSQVFTKSRNQIENELLQKLEKHLSQVPESLAKKITSRLSLRLSKQKVSTLDFNDAAKTFYKGLQKPFFQRYFSSFFRETTENQLRLSEDFYKELEKTVAESYQENLRSNFWIRFRLAWMEQQTLISWVRFFSVHSLYYGIVYWSNGPVFPFPFYVPKLSSLKFDGSLEAKQKVRIFYERLANKAMSLIFSSYMAVTLVHPELRTEFLQDVEIILNEILKEDESTP